MLKKNLLRRAWLCIPVATFVLAGCNGALVTQGPRPRATHTPDGTSTPTAGPTPVGTPTAVPPASAVSFVVKPGGGTVPFAYEGFQATLAYPGNSATTQTAAFGQTFAATIPSPVPAGSPIASYTFSVSGQVGFIGNMSVASVVLPANVAVANRRFTETLYDLTTGTTVGTPAVGTASGQTVTFGGASGGSFSAVGMESYVFYISADP